MEIRCEPTRFVAVADDQVVGWLDFAPAGAATAFTHTEVPPQFGGRGIATALVVAALDHAREQGWTLLPVCDFVRGFIATHAEYLDLVPLARRAEFEL